MNRTEAIGLALIVKKTVGALAWDDVVKAAGSSYDDIRYVWPNVLGFNLPWSDIDDEHRLAFIGLVSVLYSTGYERGCLDSVRC